MAVTLLSWPLVFSHIKWIWLTPFEVELDQWGRIKASRDQEFQYQTTNEKIFAGGDAVRYSSDLVVTAIDEGRKAAQGILDYLDV